MVVLLFAWSMGSHYTGAGLAIDRSKLNRMVLRNIVLNWILSPLLGLSSAALASVILRAIFRL
ncbi:MAG: hypothetical protein M1296_06100 [Chloroflexi bacterium]|nr:hypothetical protein [Chloroflexota bacterium]